MKYEGGKIDFIEEELDFFNEGLEKVRWQIRYILGPISIMKAWF